MRKGKVLNVMLGCAMGVSIIAAVGTSSYAKVGDNPIEYQNMYTYKDVKNGKYANIYCNPGYTQVTGNKSGYYGTLKYARYHTSELLNGKKYTKIDDEIKITTSQPCYTPYIGVTDKIYRRYHRGYIRTGTSGDSPVVQNYMRTVYKEKKV